MPEDRARSLSAFRGPKMDGPWRRPLWLHEAFVKAKPRASRDYARPCGPHVVRPRAGALRALHVDPRRSPALTGTCPGTLPGSAHAAGEEQP